MMKIMKKKWVLIVFAFVFCLFLIGAITAVASGEQKGIFKDKTNWFGTVTGNTYEQATDEINIATEYKGDELIVSVTLLKSDNVPYSEFDTFGIERYQIVDMSGKVLVKESAFDMYEIENDIVNIHIPLENFEKGEYKLIIESFVGSKKADQPLSITGLWECSFKK